MKSIFRSGIPVMGKNYFPSNIQGLPTWYEIRVTKDGYRGPLRPRRHHGRDECRDLCAGSEGSRARRLSRLRLHLAAAGAASSATTSRCSACRWRRLCNENFNGVRTRILMKNICYAGVLAALLDLDLELIRELLAETYAKKPQLVESNMKAIQLGYDYAKQNFTCPLPLHVQKMDATSGHIMIDGNTAAALGCVFAGATVAAWYPITPSTSVMDAFKGFCDRTRVDPETAPRTSPSSRRRTSSPPSAW